MAVTVLDFFKANVGHPNSLPFADYFLWNTSSSPVVQIKPANSDETLLVRRFQFTLGSNFNIYRNSHRFHIEVTEITSTDWGAIHFITDEEDNVSAAGNQRFNVSVASVIHVPWFFDPCIKLVGTGQNIEFRHMNSTSTSNDTGGVDRGTMRVGIIGWALKTADF